MKLTRRNLVIAGFTLVAVNPMKALAQGTPAIHVTKGRGCGCCTAWANILKSSGFSVSEEEILPDDLAQLKLRNGVPQHLFSCHTAKIEGYVVEGHVPPGDIRRLLAERPDAVGLTVPGMPYGSPGMGPEDERDAYQVLLIRKDGGSEVFATYEAASR